MSEEPEDALAIQLQRGGTAYVVQVLTLVGAFAFFVGAMFTEATWLVPGSGVLVAIAGIATLVARRTVVPAWSWSFLLSWLVEDPLRRQRILAVTIGTMLIGAGLLWAATSAWTIFAFD